MANEKSGSFVTGNNPSIGKSDIAGLPKECVQATYPKGPMGADRALNDSMTGIDDVQRQAEGYRNRKVSNQK